VVRVEPFEALFFGVSIRSKTRDGEPQKFTAGTLGVFNAAIVIWL